MNDKTDHMFARLAASMNDYQHYLIPDRPESFDPNGGIAVLGIRTGKGKEYIEYLPIDPRVPDDIKIKRGMFGTAPQAHPAGTDVDIFPYEFFDLTNQYTEEEDHFKLYKYLCALGI